jgi:hypothetical protein
MIGGMLEMQILTGLSLTYEGWGLSLIESSLKYEGWGLTIIGQMALSLWTIPLDDHVERSSKCSSQSFCW